MRANICETARHGYKLELERRENAGAVCSRSDHDKCPFCDVCHTCSGRQVPLTRIPRRSEEELAGAAAGVHSRGGEKQGSGEG